MLKKGVQVKVNVQPHKPEPLSIYASAIDGECFEQELAPEETRCSEEYDGLLIVY